MNSLRIFLICLITFGITGCPKPSARWGIKILPTAPVDTSCIQGLLKESISDSEVNYARSDASLQTYHVFYVSLTGATTKPALNLGVSIVEGRKVKSTSSSIVNGVPIDVRSYGKAETEYMTFGIAIEKAAQLNEVSKKEILSVANDTRKKIEAIILKAQQKCGLAFAPEAKEISCADFLCDLNK